MDRNGALRRDSLIVAMHKRTARYDVADPVNGRCPRSGKPIMPDSLFGYLGHIAGLFNSIHVTIAPPRPGRLLPQVALLAALLVCVGQSIADVHLHLDEQEEEVCTLCAISEPGHVPTIGLLVALPFESRRSDHLPEYSATLSPRPYEAAQPRAPPVSVS